MEEDSINKNKCYYCKQQGHLKRNCPKIKCFFCGENHLKKHCIKYYLQKIYLKKQEKSKLYKKESY